MNICPKGSLVTINKRKLGLNGFRPVIRTAKVNRTVCQVPCEGGYVPREAVRLGTPVRAGGEEFTHYCGATHSFNRQEICITLFRDQERK